MLSCPEMAPMREDHGLFITTDSMSSVGVPSSTSGTSADQEPIPASFSNFPSIVDHLVKPEVSRVELVRGREVDVSGAEPPHADAQARLAFLVLAHVVVGFVVSTELLTRMGRGSDFATDVCVRKDGTDPRTNTRYLEEVVFEIVNEQKKRDVTEKAEDMLRRGVRRAFAIFVKTGEICEWSAKKRKFVSIDSDGLILDRVFVRPVPVQSLLDQAAGEAEAALALIAKRNPAIVKHEQDVEKLGRKKGIVEGRKKGIVEGRKAGLAEGRKAGLAEGLDVGRELLLSMIGMRFGAVPSPLRQQILAADAQTLQLWGRRLMTSGSLEDVFAAA